MAKDETDIVHKIMLEESKHGVVLHKNVRGMFYTIGSVKSFIQAALSLNIMNIKRSVKTLVNVQAGLQCRGSGDLIGYTPTIITQDMVGKTVAIYTSMEVKTATGKPSVYQTDFIQRVRYRGGRAGIVRSPEEARNI